MSDAHALAHRSIDPRRFRFQAQDVLILGLHCDSCGLLSHPATDLCPRCGQRTGEKAWPGYGKVVAQTVVHKARPDLALSAPFQIAAIQVQDGPRVFAPVAASHTVSSGDVVRIAPIEVMLQGRPVLAVNVLPTDPSTTL